MPWFDTVVPAAAGRMVAVMVIVTVPPAGIVAFQVTVLVAVVATAVPELAEAETSERVEGSTSSNSFPGLSACVPVPPLASVTV